MTPRTKTILWACAALACLILSIFALRALRTYDPAVDLPRDERTCILTSRSPGGSWELEAIRTDWGVRPARSSISVYAVDPKTRRLIYDQLDESACTIQWQTDSIVVINGVTLDLSKGETDV